MTLSGCRQTGDNGLPQPIPLTEIMAFFELEEVKSEEDREEFLYVVREMDATLITHSVETLKEDLKRSTKK